MKPDLRTLLIRSMTTIASEYAQSLRADLDDKTPLLQSGLDSLGFAILIARMEEQLGYDPFTLMSEPVYPQTLGELVAIYETYHPDHDGNHG
jgi:aryl carrier-like protein